MTGVIANSVPQAVFGPGALYVTRNDIANQTPYNIGYAQEFSYDESAENKDLYGQNQYPLVIARGTIKASGKMKAATISGLALSACYWGQSWSSGVLRASLAENHAVPSTPFEVTVTPPSSGVYNSDLGVIYGGSGLPLVYVASGPTVGEYTVNTSTGQYTFAAADTAVVGGVNISYSYAVTGTGQKLTVNNSLIGTTPSFQIDYVTSLYGIYYYARFFACVSTKLNRSHKLTDFVMPEIDFGFFANSAGQVYEMSMDVAA